MGDFTVLFHQVASILWFHHFPVSLQSISWLLGVWLVTFLGPFGALVFPAVFRLEHCHWLDVTHGFAPVFSVNQCFGPQFYLFQRGSNISRGGLPPHRFLCTLRAALVVVLGSSEVSVVFWLLSPHHLPFGLFPLFLQGLHSPPNFHLHSPFPFGLSAI